MMQKKFSIISEYKKSFKFIKDSKKFIYIIVSIFLIFLLMGFFVSPTQNISEFILNYIKQILETTEGFGFGDMFLFIFSNNLQSSFFGLFFGIFLGIFSLFSTIGNGYILGFVLSKSVAEKGFWVVANLLPHGIFELPAVFISLGLGLKLGFCFFKKNYKKKVLSYLKKSLKVFVFVVVPLLILAAIIETFLIFLF